MKKKNSRSESISEDENDEHLYKDDEDYDYSSLKEDFKKNNQKASKVSDFFESDLSSYLKRKHSIESFDSSNDDQQINSYNDSIKEIKKKELTSLQKSYIKSQKENFDKQFNLLKTDFNLLIEYEKEIFKDTNLDIMFIMDLTGSMSMWLNEAKK